MAVAADRVDDTPSTSHHGVVTALAHAAHAVLAAFVGPARADRLVRASAAAAAARPLRFSLFVVWLAVCAVPLAAFAAYVAGWVLCAFAVFWALVLFWTGLGLVLFLVPALCVATTVAVVLWAGAVATWMVAARAPGVLGYHDGGAVGTNNAAGETADPRTRQSAGQTPLSPPQSPAGTPGAYSGGNGGGKHDGGGRVTDGTVGALVAAQA
ncbi:hypothetical protein SPI_02451 [Niveomyces insectorum RCEF 264]|uniref:Uncharacterized protein n=1 Tax=Niveomyces insectorum RCEF 264 TaxID=1081102 RepID=A0A167Y0F6_9HYPO|nr:hypothetical protein SPI_02451 [Niveomyces insectorum RCEF 264]